MMRGKIMLTKIKDMFKKNEKTYFYANLIRFSRNEEFRDCVRSFNSCDVIHIQHPGELFPQSIYYCIKNHGSGFWSEVLLTMQYLQFAELFKLVPVICWDKSGIYVEDFPINGTKNGFEYYFEPVSEIEYQKVYDCRNVIYSTIRHRFPDGKQLEYPDYFSRIERYGTLYKTFFHLNAVTKKYIRNNIDNIFMNSRGGIRSSHQGDRLQKSLC